MKQRKILILIYILLNFQLFSQNTLDIPELLSFIFPPFTDGMGNGITEKYLIDVFKSQDLELKINKYPFTRAFSYLKDKGNYNKIMIMGKLYDSYNLEEDFEKIILSINYSTYIFNKDIHPTWVEHKPNLEGKKIGVLRGTILNDESLINTAQIVEVNSIDNVDKLLASNRIDIFQTLYGTALSYIQENIEDRKDLEIAMWYRNKIVINLVIPKKNKKLISSIRQGILDVGSYNTYKERVDISPD